MKYHSTEQKEFMTKLCEKYNAHKTNTLAKYQIKYTLFGISIFECYDWTNDYNVVASIDDNRLTANSSLLNKFVTGNTANSHVNRSPVYINDKDLKLR